MRGPKVGMEALVGFVTVVESGTWDGAAGELGITMSALQKRMKQLSELLGAGLLAASNKSVIATEAGQLFYREAVLALEHAALAEEKTKAHLLLRANHILVGHSTYLPPTLLKIIQNSSPDLPRQVRIEHRPGLTPEIIERVAQGTLHVGVGILPFRRDGVLTRTLHEEPLVVCIPSDHPLAAKTEIRPQNLDGVSVIAVSRHEMPALHEGIDEYFRALGVELEIAADAFCPSEALVYVQQKMGVCLVARSSVGNHKGVTVRPLAARTLTRKSGLFLREDNGDPLVAEFVDVVLRKSARLSRIAS